MEYGPNTTYLRTFERMNDRKGRVLSAMLQFLQQRSLFVLVLASILVGVLTVWWAGAITLIVGGGVLHGATRAVARALGRHSRRISALAADAVAKRP